MTRRRLPAVVLTLVAIVAAVTAIRHERITTTPTFSVAVAGWMPAAPTAAGLTETWFCPGVPATGIDEIEGEIVIANRDGARMIGTVLLVNDRSESQRLDLAVDGWSSASVDLDSTLPGAMVGAVVEVDGGGAIVEQRSFHPSGDSSAPCANATSDAWYLADGFTVEGSLDQIVLTNPFDQTVVADLEFATREGSRSPIAYQGLTVAPRSVKVVDLGAPGAGAQGESILAVTVTTARGRLVVGRFQQFLGGGRFGTQVSLGSPALRDHWWFANGYKGPGIDERFNIYNPTDDDVEVDALFLGVAEVLDLIPITVPSHQVVTFEPSSVAGLPDGRHAMVFSALGKQSIVVERATTTAVGTDVSTSVIAGATPRHDGYVATTWYLAAGPAEPTEAGLIVFNVDNTPGTVSVFAVGSSGPVPVPGLQDVVLPTASIITLDLTDPIVIGRELVIESTSRVFIERSSLTGRGGTRTSSWAVPAN